MLAENLCLQVTCEQIDKSFDSLVEVVNTRRQQVKDLLKETHETRHRFVNEQLVEIDNQTTRLIAIREQLNDATCKGRTCAYMSDTTTSQTAVELAW